MSIRRVEITVPHDQFDNVLTLLTHSCKIPRWTGTGGVVDHVVALSGPTHHVFQIMCAGHKVGGVIRQLETIGCGEEYGQISVTTLDAARPGLDAPSSLEQRESSAKRAAASADSLFKGQQHQKSIEEVYSNIRDGAELSFNSACNLACAAVIAGVGLAVDSAVSVVASMLISPMMGPILGFTLGAHIGDWELFRVSVRNELKMIAISWTAGVVMGVLFFPMASAEPDASLRWPTKEMTGRGDVVNLIASIAVAIASGVVVGVGVTSGGVNSLVGTAISASLLPPIVNSGMLAVFGLALKRGARTDDEAAFAREYFEDESVGVYDRVFVDSAVSFGLFLLNVVLIFLSCSAMFQIKGIRRQGRSDEDSWAKNRAKLADIQQKKKQMLELKYSLDQTLDSRAADAKVKRAEEEARARAAAEAAQAAADAADAVVATLPSRPN